MKKNLLVFLVFLLSLNTYSQNGKINGDNVNFRSDTLITSDNIIRQLNSWNHVKILEKGPKWYRIRHLDDIGYVYSEFVSENLSFSKKMNNLSLFQVFILIIIISSFFLPRILMYLIILVENRTDYDYVDRKFTKKLDSFLNNTKIENFYLKIIGNSFNETSSWLIRIGSLLLFPLILLIAKVVIDFNILKHNYQLNIELLSSSIYNSIITLSFIIILVFILSCLVYEIFVSNSKIEFLRVPLMLILLIYVVPITCFGLIYFSIIYGYIIVRKTLSIFFVIIKFLSPFILKILSIFLGIISTILHVASRRERGYHDSY